MKALPIQATVLVVGAWLSLATHVFAQQPSVSALATQQAAVPLVNQYAIFDTFLTCEEANRTAHQSVERLGYKVTAFTPATANAVGVIKGSRSFIPLTLSLSLWAHYYTQVAEVIMNQLLLTNQP